MKSLFFVSLILIVTFKCFFSQGELLGGGEVFGHAWSHWQSTTPPPEGFQWAIGNENFSVIDPLPAFISTTIGGIFGPATGYNTWICISVFLAAFGGWKLALALKGNPYIGAIALAWSPPFIGALHSGLTEDSAVGLIALAMAALIKGHGFQAGIFLGLTAWCGMVLGWIGALVVGLWGLVTWRKKTLSTAALAKCGIIAVLIAIPAIWPHLERILHPDANPAQLAFIPNWHLNPIQHIDIASPFILGHADVEDINTRIHPGYLGFSLIVLSLFSKRWFLMGICLLLLGLSFGANIYANGSMAWTFNPIHWIFDWIPGSSALRHHGRVLLGASVILAATASLGAVAGKIKPWFVLPFLMVDLLFASPVSPTLPMTPSCHSEALIELKKWPAGNLLMLPVSGPEISHQKALWMQQMHHKPLRLNPNRPGMLKADTRTEFGQWLNGMAYGHEVYHGKTVIKNVTYLAVRNDFTPQMARLLGNPKLSDAQWSIWKLTD